MPQKPDAGEGAGSGRLRLKTGRQCRGSLCDPNGRNGACSIPLWSRSDQRLL